MERRLAAILAADLVGYTRLIRVDEEGTIAALKDLRITTFDPIIAQHHGRIVKLMGDGVLVEFSSVVDAVRAATQFQQSLLERNAEHPKDSWLEFRVGVNLGDVVIDGDDIHGDGVNLAARLEGLADPGGVCISDSVHDQVRDRLDLKFADLGDREVKNIDRPIRVWQWSIQTAKNVLNSNPLIPDSGEDQRPRIAILPFDNMSGDSEQEYFSDGITEDIITELSKVSALFVVARNTTFMYKNRPKNLQVVARELSVDHLVEGSVRKSGNRVRINAQLIDGKSGGHTWAEKYDRELTDIFEVQDEITAEIISALRIALQTKGTHPSENTRTQDMDAYDLFLRGRRLQHQFYKPSLELAIQLFRQATSLDPNYARAYCGIADTSAFLYQFYKKTPKLLDDINDNSTKALILAPNMAEAHASRGNAYYTNNDFINADKAFEKAVELDRNLYEAHYYWGRAHMSRGNSEEAAKHFYNALDVSPNDDQSAMLLTQMLADQGKTKETIQIAQRSVENALRKQKVEPDSVRAYLGAAFGYLRLGNMEGAKQQAEMAKALDPDENSIHYNLACLYALIGDQDSALDRLEHCFRVGEYNKAWIENDSDWDTLREHPRFIALFEVME